MTNTFPLYRLPHRFKTLCARAAFETSGVSAIEFALILPIMLSLYLGSVEISQAISASRKVTLTARTVADLVAQATAVTTADMTNILDASTAVVTPFSTATLGIVVSSIEINAAGAATVAWSKARNATPRAPNPITLPTGLGIPNSSLILAEVTFVYTPAIGYVLTGPITLRDRIYMRPRLSNSILEPT